MRKNFLVGNFLPAYSDVFRYRRREGDRPKGLTSEQLEERFGERAARHRSRGRQYGMRLQLGLVVAMAVSVTAVRVDFFPRGEAQDFTMADQELVAIEEILQTRQIEQPPPPPRPPVPVAVPDDVLLTDVDLDLDASLDLNESIAALPAPPPEAAQELPEEDEDEIFVAVEREPELIGGLASLRAVLDYPQIARKAGLEGTVVVQIVVNKDGLPSDPEVRKSVAQVLDQAAVDAVMKQRFNPGLQRGRPVRVLYTVPVVFRLTG